MYSMRINFTSNGGRAERTKIHINIGLTYTSGDQPTDPQVNFQLSQIGSEGKSAIYARKSYTVNMTPDEARSLATYLISKADEADTVTKRKQ